MDVFAKIPLSASDERRLIIIDRLVGMLQARSSDAT
jgi:hypothetical protein